MLSWVFVGVIGCLCMVVTDGQDPPSALSDRESRQDGITQFPDAVPDNAEPVVAESTNVVVDSEAVATTTVAATTITTQTAEPFSCYQCANCSTKTDLTTTLCPVGITTCYTMHRQVNNVSQVIHRGCAMSNDRCTVSDSDQLNSLNTVICCKGPKCNQANQSLPTFFLSVSSLVIILINNRRT